LIILTRKPVLHVSRMRQKFHGNTDLPRVISSGISYRTFINWPSFFPEIFSVAITMSLSVHQMFLPPGNPPQYSTINPSGTPGFIFMSKENQPLLDSRFGLSLNLPGVVFSPLNYDPVPVASLLAEQNQLCFLDFIDSFKLSFVFCFSGVPARFIEKVQ